MYVFLLYLITVSVYNVYENFNYGNERKQIVHCVCFTYTKKMFNISVYIYINKFVV